jgi:hypothetical protein
LLYTIKIITIKWFKWSDTFILGLIVLNALWISEFYTYFFQVLHLEKRSQLIIPGKALNIQTLNTNRNCNDSGASDSVRMAKARIGDTWMDTSSTVVDLYSPTAKTASHEVCCSLAVKWRWIFILVVHIKYRCRTASVYISESHDWIRVFFKLT